jgi:hypothetical protein
VVFASDVPYGDQLTAQHVVARALRHAGVGEAAQRGVLGETALALVDGRLPERVSPPVEAPLLHVGYDRMRVHTYLAAATPLLWSGQRDVIGFLGLAAGACADGDGTLEPVGELIAGAQAAWLAALEVDDPDEAARRRRTAFKLLHLGQALSLLA